MTNQTNSTRQTSDQRYRHLFDHAPICIFVIDLTASPATILQANRRAALVYGYPTDDLVGMTAAHLALTEAKPDLLTMVQRVQQGHIVTTETTNRHRDGTLFPVRIIATLDPTDDSYMIVTVEEISAEKQNRSEADAIARERLRIAQEVHDGVTQSLAGLRFKSAVWSHLDGLAPPSMHAALDELQTVLADTIIDLRRSIFALRPLDLELLGCLPALTQLVNDFGDQRQLVAQLDLSGVQGTLPAAYELPLFRIIQEGLTNIGQHARATSVLVRLMVDAAGGVRVALRDNGCGFDPHQLGAAGSASHFGLHQMRERILAQGGTLDIHSALGQGTELLITLPPLVQGAIHDAG